MNALALAALVGVVLALSEPSQTPPPTPLPTAANEQQEGGNTEAVSRPIKQPVVGPAVNDEHAGHKRGHRRKKSSNDPMIWFTGVLAFAALAQIGVTWVQARHMQRGLRVSMEAAYAAQESARIAKKSVELAEHNTAVTQRAMVLIDSIKFGGLAGKAMWHLNPGTVFVFTLKNYGATVAENVRVTGCVTCLGVEMTLHGAQQMTIAPQGTNHWITRSINAVLQGDDKFMKLNGPSDPTLLTYRVEVTYTDIFGNRHSYAADGQYLSILRDFVTGSSTFD